MQAQLMTRQVRRIGAVSDARRSWGTSARVATNAILRRDSPRAAALIFLGFLFTSTGWLAWSYHMPGQVPEGATDLITMVAGYLLQAAGIAIYAIISQRAEPSVRRAVPVGAIVACVAFMVPAVMSPYAVGTVLFGLLMNIACGLIAGHYLSVLASSVPAGRRATAFGCGYGLSVVASWVLSAVGGGSIYYSNSVLVICALMAVAAISLILTWPADPVDCPTTLGQAGPRPRAVVLGRVGGVLEVWRSLSAENRKLIPSASALVLLFGIVYSCGMAFSVTGLSGVVHVELSRSVYALGLVIAGLATDRSRRGGAICALAGLVIPFIILSLSGETIPATAFWALSYFTFGFYSVYRIVLFSDLSIDRNLMHLAGFGLLVGRIGEALGKAICMALAGSLIALVCVTALLFVGSVAVFFLVYQRLYVPVAEKGESDEHKRFHHFAASHDLSSREQDILRLLLDRRTNTQIAADLSISENTVKFHVRNLLQKVGCPNRNELLHAYWESSRDE